MNNFISLKASLQILRLPRGRRWCEEEEMKLCPMHWRLLRNCMGAGDGVLKRKNEKSQGDWESTLLLWDGRKERRERYISESRVPLQCCLREAPSGF